MTTHTPGPWIISEHCATLIMGADGKRSVCSAGGYSTNTLPDNGQGENIANARLIRATPDFLEACLLLIEQYEAVDDYKMGGKLTNKPFLMIKAAISKATGQNND